jgi:hypothetical protein
MSAISCSGRVSLAKQRILLPFCGGQWGKPHRRSLHSFHSNVTLSLTGTATTHFIQNGCRPPLISLILLGQHMTRPAITLSSPTKPRFFRLLAYAPTRRVLIFMQRATSNTMCKLRVLRTAVWQLQSQHPVVPYLEDRRRKYCTASTRACAVPLPTSVSCSRLNGARVTKLRESSTLHASTHSVRDRLDHTYGSRISRSGASKKKTIYTHSNQRESQGQDYKVSYHIGAKGALITSPTQTCLLRRYCFPATISHQPPLSTTRPTPTPSRMLFPICALCAFIHRWKHGGTIVSSRLSSFASKYTRS